MKFNIDSIETKFYEIMENGMGLFLFASYILVFAFILSEGLRDCDNVDFVDIKSKNKKICIITNDTKICDNVEVFLLEEDVTTSQFRNEMKIKDLNEDTTGYFFEKSDGKDNKFRYAYIDEDDNRDYVVATIRKKSFIVQTRYIFKRCDNTGSKYEIREQIGYNEGDFELYKDKKLIAKSSSFVDFVCTPDITFTYIDSDMPLAIISKECGTIESFLTDKWIIFNYNQTLVDNYVFGFLGYISTFNSD